MNNEGSICGHERDALRWALGYPYKDTETICSPAFRYNGCPRCRALREVADPAKLAEMMAAEAMRLGLEYDLWFEPYGSAKHGNVSIQITDIRKDGVRLVVLEIARKILLVWLDLGDGDSEGALRAMGGVT